jgi:predicted Zn-dependent protease with MMP-like domain
MSIFSVLPRLRDPQPSLDAFGHMAERAFENLPAVFRDLCGDVVVRVQDWPDGEILDAMSIRSRYGLLGLYHGISIDRCSNYDLPHGPDFVFLYRRPILQYAIEEGDSVEDVVTHVLVHEIGHHFGLTDDDMERIENATD